MNLFGWFKAKPKEPIRNELCDKFAAESGLDSDKIMLYARLNMTADGRSYCDIEDFRYAVEILTRMKKSSEAIAAL